MAMLQKGDAGDPMDAPDVSPISCQKSISPRPVRNGEAWLKCCGGWIHLPQSLLVGRTLILVLHSLLGRSTVVGHLIPYSICLQQSHVSPQRTEPHHNNIAGSSKPQIVITGIVKNQSRGCGEMQHHGINDKIVFKE